MNKRILLTAAVFGALAVALGAFGAHGLRNVLDAGQLGVWQKAVEYQFYHVAVLLFLALAPQTGNRLFRMAFIFFTTGIILFSGSLYIISLAGWWGMPGLRSVLGPVTPLGGLSLIIGWICLFLAALKHK